MKKVFLVLLFGVSCFAKGLKLHPKDPFECTFHFINLSATEFLIFDIIRSEVNGNSIRFVHLDNGKVDSILIKGRTANAFKFEKNRIYGEGESLSFDLQFETITKGARIPPIAGFGYDISLIDYPLVQYSGKAKFGDKEWTIKDKSVGSISHHFGNKLPVYYYFNTLRSDEASPHVVGAFAVIPHSVFPPIRSGYLVVTRNKKVKSYNLLNSSVSLLKNQDGSTSMVVDPFLGKKFEVQLVAGSEEQMYQHTLEGVATTLQFDSTVTLGDTKLPAVIDVRGEL